MPKSKWGKFISSCDMKDGTTMSVYRNGNMIYFIVDDKIDKSFHVEDAAEILGALIGVDNESSV